MADFSLLLPIASVAMGAMLVLLAEVLLPRPVRRGGEVGAASGGLVASISTTSLLVAIFFAWHGFSTGSDGALDSLRPMLRFDAFSSLGTAIVGLGALLSLWLATAQLPLLRIPRAEYHALLLLSTAGMFVLMASADLLSAYLSVELMSVPLYALAAFDRRSRESRESGLKFFLSGALASVVLLYGMALLYGATGHGDFAAIAASPLLGSPLAVAGLGLIVAGLVCRLGAAPFHQWAVDVLQGAPSSLSAFLIVAAPATVLVTLVRVLALQPAELGARMGDVLRVLAALSLLIGSAMALIQVDLKRILAYTSISNVGLGVIALAAGTSHAHAALLFTLLAFAFINVGAFAVLVALTRDGEGCETLADLPGLAQRRPGLAAVLTLFLLALVGVPGTAGFIAKFMILSAAVEAGFVGLAIAGVLASLLGLACYVRLLTAMYMGAEDAPGEELRDPEEQEDPPTRGMRSLDLSILALCTIAVLYLGVLPMWAPFDAAARGLAPQSAVEELLAAEDPNVPLAPGDVELVE